MGRPPVAPDVEAVVPRGVVVAPALAIVHFDGACQERRGIRLAAYGFTVEGSGLEHEECGPAVAPGAPHATNNVAEYVGAIRALEHLLRQGFEGGVMVRGDSELVIRQMTGDYQVRAPHLSAYHDLLVRLAERFRPTTFEWVPREQNRRADELSKEALEVLDGGPRRSSRPARRDARDAPR